MDSHGDSHGRWPTLWRCDARGSPHRPRRTKGLDGSYSVRQNSRVEYAGFSWAAAARKHGVSRAQVQFVVGRVGVCFVRPALPPDRPDEAVLFVGDDEAGEAVEVVGVELADGSLRVIHAMPMRSNYRPLYEEAKKWQQ